MSLSATKFRPSRLKLQRRQFIPYHIYQTQEFDKIPPKMKAMMDMLLNHNPEYTYHYFSDDDCRTFIRKHFGTKLLKIYDTLIPGAYKADLFRCCVLYIKGGVYIDSTFASIKPLEEIIKSNDKLLLVKDRGTHGIYNAFMAGIKRHPFFKSCIKAMVNSVQTKYYGHDALCPTGPTLLGNLFKKEFGLKEITEGYYGKHVRLLEYFPLMLYWKGEKQFITKYPGFQEDLHGYNSQPHYPILWSQRKIYKEFF